jgi:hypothetical protein
MNLPAGRQAKNHKLLLSEHFHQVTQEPVFLGFNQSIQPFVGL